MPLKDIKGPQDLKHFSYQQLEQLSDELRQRILQVVSKNGGHLASNLGVVELSIALHRVFDSPRDKLVFDVGHQCYAHKMLTGRDHLMEDLRQYGGVSGFPKIEESPHDAYGTGHASTAISAALGLARARDLQGGDHHVVAVVGDGAMTGGLSYEGLNDAGMHNNRLIVILNDNQMSIARNVGGLSNYLTYMRTSKAWIDIKRGLATFFLKIPLIGESLHKLLQRVKDSIRNVLVKDGFFEALGFHYLGPIDGHNQRQVEKLLQRAKRFKGPVLLHLVTQKGKGYPYAEQEPWSTHGVNPFNPENGQPTQPSTAPSFGKAAGEELVRLAKDDKNIVAISAAMTEATGLGPFQAAYPDRFYDVGIAESHAVALAAGLAVGGLRPVVALYDTFLQRAYDQVVVDVCLQKLPVTFIVDRAAMGGADGPTHHGVFGTAMLRHVPGLTLLYPRSVEELRLMLRYAVKHDGPAFIRYPRSQCQGMEAYPVSSFTPGVWEKLLSGKDVSLLAMGPLVSQALKARELLEQQGISAQVINASSQKPLDTAMIKELARSKRPYITLEEQVLAGGLGSAICEYCAQHGLKAPALMLSLPDQFITHGSHSQLLCHVGLDAASIANKIRGLMEQTA